VREQVHRRHLPHLIGQQTANDGKSTAAGPPMAVLSLVLPSWASAYPCLDELLKNFLSDMWLAAMDLNRSNILDCVPLRPGSKLVDLGCDDGAWTMELARRAGTSDVWGVEIVPERAAAAEQRGVRVAVSDLARPLPFPDSTFDVLHANQVIEHVPDIDLFMSEIARILRPGGLAILSTENGSSWVNVGAAILGWQIFSLTNVSAKRLGIGNPMALHRGERQDLSSWTHKTIFNFRGLKELCGVYGLGDSRIFGAGYFPLPARLGRLDPRHAHFITISAVKTPAP